MGIFPVGSWICMSIAQSYFEAIENIEEGFASLAHSGECFVIYGCDFMYDREYFQSIIGECS